MSAMQKRLSLPQGHITVLHLNRLGAPCSAPMEPPEQQGMWSESKAPLTQAWGPEHCPTRPSRGPGMCSAGPGLGLPPDTAEHAGGGWGPRGAATRTVALKVPEA